MKNKLFIIDPTYSKIYAVENWSQWYRERNYNQVTLFLYNDELLMKQIKEKKKYENVYLKSKSSFDSLTTSSKNNNLAVEKLVNSFKKLSITNKRKRSKFESIKTCC